MCVLRVLDMNGRLIADKTVPQEFQVNATWDSEPQQSCKIEEWPEIPADQEQPHYNDDCDSDGEIPGFLNKKNIPHPQPGELREDLKEMLPKNELTPKQMTLATDLIKEYEDIFIGLDGRVGFTNRVKHRVDTGDSNPIRTPPYRRSFREKDEMDRQIDDLLECGKIRKSESPWASPVVMVQKKDGSFRFCIDYRRVNAATKKDAYPLPRIDDALDSLGGASWFSTLDLASGYWQVAMDPESEEKTAFVTHRGLFQWLVMPFGLCNAPATFERLMEGLLGDIQWTHCLVYLDDIVAFGSDFQAALHNLELVFQRLRTANLKLKPSKCCLFRRKVEYLGHVVSEDGIKACPSKIKAVKEWPTPKNVHDIRAFLMGYRDMMLCVSPEL